MNMYARTHTIWPLTILDFCKHIYMFTHPIHTSTKQTLSYLSDLAYCRNFCPDISCNDLMAWGSALMPWARCLRGPVIIGVCVCGKTDLNLSSLLTSCWMTSSFSSTSRCSSRIFSSLACSSFSISWRLPMLLSAMSSSWDAKYWKLTNSQTEVSAQTQTDCFSLC